MHHVTFYGGVTTLAYLAFSKTMRKIPDAAYTIVVGVA